MTDSTSLHTSDCVHDTNGSEQNSRPAKHRVDREKAIVRDFHCQYYEGGSNSKQCDGLHTETYYHGIETHKCPLDLWVFQELLFKVRPAIVVELGSYLGGSALFLAHQMDAMGVGSIVSIDNRDLPHPAHRRIQFLLGNTLDPRILSVASDLVAASDGPVMVIHDADHHYAEVLADLEAYQQFVSVDSYLIVEDTNVNGHPVLDEWGPGPWEAVDQLFEQPSNV